MAQTDPWVFLQSGKFRRDLAKSWRKAQETGGPLVVTSTDVIEFAVFPLFRSVRIAHRQMVRDFARRIFHPLAGREVPPEFADFMPSIGPNNLRREYRESCRKFRTWFTPWFYTLYDQPIGVLFPIPYDDGLAFLLKLAREWYPERNEVPAP